MIGEDKWRGGGTNARTHSVISVVLGFEDGDEELKQRIKVIVKRTNGYPISVRNKRS